MGLSGAAWCGAIQIPRCVDPVKRPTVDGATAILWRFDDGDVSDATGWHNEGEPRGEVKVVPGGRFGKCLSLSGGKDAVVLKEIRGLTPTEGGNRMTVEFWIRFDKPPASRQCLFELAAFGKEPAIGLDLLPGGKLSLRGPTLVETVSENALPPGKWFHIAIVGYAKAWPRGIGVQYSGAAARVDGRRFVTAISSKEHYGFPHYTFQKVFCLGNRLACDAGFTGFIDEFRLSGAARGFYAVTAEPWLDPQNEKPIRRSATHFRDPGSVVFHESFEGEHTLEKLRAESKDLHRPLPGSVEADLTDPVTEADVDDDPVTEIPDTSKVREVRKAKVETRPGVKGRALALEGTHEGVDLALPAGLGLTSATIEFWFKPCDWDNFTLRRHRSQAPYLHSKLLLLTLYGKPKDGEGEDQILVKLRASRLRSSREAAFTLHPYHWTHVAIVWGKGVQHHQPNLYFDGEWVGYDTRSSLCTMAGPDVWEKHVPAYIRLGNFMGTAYDELRVYGHPLLREEARNAYGSYTGTEMQELGAALCSFDYRMSLGKLSVVVTAALMDPSQAARARVALDLPHQNRTINLTVPEFTHGSGRTEQIDVGELPEGDYACRGVLLDKDGKDLGEFKTKFQRVKLPWLRNRLGIVETPPPPFTPITVEGNVVRCVERRYAIGASGLPESIVVRDEEILAGPARFGLTQGGKAVEMRPSVKTQFGKGVPVEANWAATVEGGGLSIASSVKLEYDGMAKYELVLAPVAGAAAIERLSLTIPLKERYADMIHVIPRSGSWYKLANFLPSGDGVVWDSKTWTKRCKQDKIALGNFMPMVWLGGRVRGLCWFADNDKGWVPNENQPAITVSRADGTTTLDLHFISEPYTLKEPRTIVFGLLATPPKPLPKDYRLWNRRNNKEVGVIGGRLTSCEAFAGWDIPPKRNCFDFWPKNYDWGYAEKAAAQQRVSKNPKYGNGKAHMMYQLPTFIPMSRRDGAYFQWEWFRSGGRRSASPYPPSKVDCLVWYMSEWFRRDIMDGVYLDGFTPAGDYNHETGTAYVLPDGRIQPGNAFFGYRDYIKRMHAILASLGKPPLITAHSTSAMPIPLLAFGSVHFDGEDVARFRNLDVTFIDAWSLDRLMVLNNAERTSLVSVVMLKGAYVTRGKDEIALAHTIRRMNRSAYAVWLLFDMNVGGPGGGMGRIINAYRRPDAEVLPFWRNEHVLTVEALLKEPVTDEKLLPKRSLWVNKEFRESIGREPLRATLYRKQGRALLIVSNFLRQPVQGRVTIDLRALGVPEDRQAAFKVRDIDDWPEAKGYDIRRLGDPKIEEGFAALEVAPLGERVGLGTEELKLETKKAAPDPLLKGNVITLKVKDHDFRAVELVWTGD